jgi:hypothetical protein
VEESVNEDELLFEPETVIMPLEHAFGIAKSGSDFHDWLLWRRELGDPGPVHVSGGEVWTAWSEREQTDMSAMLASNEGIEAGAVERSAAKELGEAMNQALRSFMVEHEALIRRACQVPDSVTKLEHVVVCGFLGHTLEQLRLASNRTHVDQVVSLVLDQLEGGDAERRLVTEALQ